MYKLQFAIIAIPITLIACCAWLFLQMALKIHAFIDFTAKASIKLKNLLKPGKNVFKTKTGRFRNAEKTGRR